jgi:GT2 family glycosyltransferase
MRARLAGYDCAVAPEAIAYHVGSASLGGKIWWRARQCFRNHALLIIKNYPLALLARYWPAIARERAHQARMMFSSARAEFGFARAIGIFLGAAGSLIVALPGAVRARGHLRRRVLSNRDFMALLARPEDGL